MPRKRSVGGDGSRVRPFLVTLLRRIRGHPHQAHRAVPKRVDRPPVGPGRHPRPIGSEHQEPDPTLGDQLDQARIGRGLRTLIRSTGMPSDDASSTGRFTDAVTSGVNSSRAS